MATQERIGMVSNLISSTHVLYGEIFNEKIYLKVGRTEISLKVGSLFVYYVV